MLSERGERYRAGRTGQGRGGGLAAPCKDILGNLADNDYNFYNTLSLFCTA